jgi:WD40 repeat protein
MPPKPLASLAALLLTVTAASVSAEDAKPKVNFTDNVSAIFQNRCNSCHNGDKKKGGLTLETYGGVMAGGGSGAVVEPGDAGNSRLFLLCSHEEEPKMPPMQPKIPDAEINTIKAWIDGGAPENSGSVVVMKPKNDFKLDPSSIGKPIGDPAMPTGVSTEPVVLSARPNAVIAMAHSPWAPLLAVAGHKQILLYNTQNQRLAGVLPFPEGTIHSLRFSRDGGMLVAGGGRGGQLGRAVVFDVKTGGRVFEVGKEYDVVLSADISPDRTMIALGGPSKMLRVYATADGELIYESKKHTEWVTAIEFSPDGVLLASGDRNGGLLVWEAATGREFYDLRGHAGMITDVSWRLDSNMLASSSEDTTVRLWEMQNGTQVKSFGAHGGGTESVKFSKDGRLVTTGRDNVAKLWDGNGGQQRQFENFPDVALAAVFTQDDGAIIASDWSGLVRMFESKEGKRIGEFSANPPAITARLNAATVAYTAAQAAADAATKELAALQANSATTADAMAKAQAAFDAATQAHQQTTAKLNDAQNLWNQKWSVEVTASLAHWNASFTNGRLGALKNAADFLVNERIAAKGSADSTFAATQAERDRILAEKAGAELAAAQAEAKSLADQVAAAQAADQSTTAAHNTATAERTAVEPGLNELRKSMQELNAALPARRNELTAATAAKAAADKAVADKTPAVAALTAAAAARKADVDALTAEKQLADAAKPTATASAEK